jgi:FAD/FMN-containing dehydrogenase
VSVTNINTGSELDAARHLRTVMQGAVVLQGEDDYAQARQIWNGAVQNQAVIFAVCETSDHSHRQWARSVSENLAPYALPGGYPNLLGPDEHEQAAQACAYNIGRLQRVKQLFDPDCVFSPAISLPPETAA